MGLRWGKSWVPALEPGTFFRNDIQKSANFLCIAFLGFQTLPFGHKMHEMGLGTLSILNSDGPGMETKSGASPGA